MRPIDIIREKSRRRTLSVLGEHGVSLVEYHVMITVGYGIVLKPDELASWSVGEASGDPRGEFPLSEHLDAVNHCIEKQWLALLTPEECEREAERRQSERLPDLTDTFLSPGAVDFTQEGYLIYRKLTLGINGKEHLQFKDSGWNLDDERKEVHILAETEERCRMRIEEFTGKPSFYIGEIDLPVQVVNVSGPTPVGPWRPNRFIIIPNGFYAKVDYKVLSTT
jgi:hypothetical protein